MKKLRKSTAIVLSLILVLAATTLPVFAQTASPFYEYKGEIVDSQTQLKVKIGYASGQPTNGTVFASTGGFYWQDGSPDVSVSVGVGYGVFSVSVGVGKAGGTGTWITSPYLKVPVKLLIYKDIKVTRVKMYKRPLNGLTWEFDRYDYVKEPTRVYLEVVKV